MFTQGYGTGKGAGYTPITGNFFITINNLCPECKYGEQAVAAEADLAFVNTRPTIKYTVKYTVKCTVFLRIGDVQGLLTFVTTVMGAGRSFGELLSRATTSGPCY